jgi:hypothetical protein
MPRMFALHSAELGVVATAQELDATLRRTMDHLRTSAADLSFSDAAIAGDDVTFTLTVVNKGGHKLPTAYPSRRAWLHVTVEDAAGRVVFESGGLDPTGAIRGNDNDRDAARFEPHHLVIDREDQVQIYEPILADASGNVTTGLIRAVRYVKDNRILPNGFDKQTAEADIAVRGEAMDDPNFEGGRDTVRFIVETSGARGPFTVRAALMYQPIAYRWAHNLGGYQTAESERFIRLYGSLSREASVRLAEATCVVQPSLGDVAEGAVSGIAR